QAKLVEDRDDIVQKCTIVGQKKDQRNVAAAFAASAAAAAAALLTVALTTNTALLIPFFGWAVWIAAWAAFAIALAISLAASGSLIALVVQLNQANSDLADAQSTFRNDSKDVMKKCPSECWGDLTMPTCSN